MSGIPSVTAVIGATPFAVTLTDDLGHRWVADEPREAGGANEGPTPERLLLGSLGACTAITLRMYAGRKTWPLLGVEVQLELNPTGAPGAGINEIRRRIALRGELTPGQRERLLEIANKCPIHRLLTGEVRIVSELL
ncbi:MAG TPA: OsmC family protein [Steroidobacteraceae bacterium]|nr:OsmC family protein [Steroidobacteraceae bacterium]